MSVWLVSWAAAAPAQIRAAQLTSDNDAYLFWIPGNERPDYEYTNGLRAAVTVEGSPGWTGLARLLGSAAAGSGNAERGHSTFTRFELGHAIYTPRFDSAVPLPGQRPFAGWLAVGVTGTVVSGPIRQSAGVTLGVTGPPSLAEPVAKRIHSVLGVYEPMGWDHQLATEPGLLLGYAVESDVAAAHAADRRVADLAVEGGATLGNVRTGAHAGATGRVGTHLLEPFVPASPGAPRASVYAVGGLRSELVARDIFLDGNSFQTDAPRVTRNPLVMKVYGGVGFGYGGLSLEYRLTSRTRAYREEPGGHTIGTIQIDWRAEHGDARGTPR